MLTLCLIARATPAILLGGYRYHTGDQSGHVLRHGYCDEAKVGRLNRSADMFVLAVTGTVDTTFLSSSLL
jgi:hypothetical protein